MKQDRIIEFVCKNCVNMDINKKTALKAIQELYSRIPYLRKVKEDDEEYRLWKFQVDNVIKQIFKEDSSEYKSIHAKLFPVVGMPLGIKVDYREIYLKRLDALDANLKGLESGINLLGDESVITDNDAVSTLTNILSRFHRFARQLKHRHNNRNTIDIDDEYDVQDLLHAILKLHFDDIRPEENLPNYAGSSSRVDFALKNEKILVEVKKTRKGLKDKELGEQLILDKAHYRINQDYDTLVCFIYDPEELINNPTALEKDLNETNSELNVIVVISPKY